MFAINPKALSSLVTLAAVPLALACQPGDQGQQDMEQGQQPGQQSQQQMQEEEQTQRSQRRAAMSESVSLNRMYEHELSGEVNVAAEGNTLRVDVNSQMDVAGEYPSHIHEGTCDQPGDVAMPLNSPTAEESGAAEVTTEVQGSNLEAGNPYLVMVHNQEGEPALCANIPQPIIDAVTQGN